MVHDTTYERPYGHVAITPSAAILDRGAQAQFTAPVTGLSSAAGTYAVTATSVADPTQRTTARIDILAPSAGTVSGAGASFLIASRTESRLNPGLIECTDEQNLTQPTSGLTYQSRTVTCATGIPVSSAQSQATGTLSATSGSHIIVTATGNSTASSGGSHIPYTSTSGGFSFRVSGGPVTYHLTGQLRSNGPAGGEALDHGGGQYSLKSSGGAVIGEAVISSGAGSGLPQTADPNLTGTLQPGDYNLLVSSFGQLYNTGTAGGSYSFTLELGQ